MRRIESKQSLVAPRTQWHYEEAMDGADSQSSPQGVQIDRHTYILARRKILSSSVRSLRPSSIALRFNPELVAHNKSHIYVPCLLDLPRRTAKSSERNKSIFIKSSRLGPS
jgi:hypothetical protein